MPVSRDIHNTTSSSDCLRPYTFHGIRLDVAGAHGIGDCPFCGQDGKFCVEVATGLGHCWSCTFGFNPLTFTRRLYERAVDRPQPALNAAVAADRRLARELTPAAWGVGCAADGAWLVPGYSPAGRVDQVYRRIRVMDRGEWVWRLLPTPNLWPAGQGHALHLPIADWDAACDEVYVCEGPWDGMALWEVAGTRGSPIRPSQIVAVPGCSVWRDEWSETCRGKVVMLLYDSDHPPVLGGYRGMQRVANRLSGIATKVRWLRWGADGFDPTKPSGWDIRDHLCQADNLSGRQAMLEELLSKVEDVPREWFVPSVPATINGYPTTSVESLPCYNWAECEASWRQALEWREDMSDALAVILAVCASTRQAGNQLFIDLIGSPGSAKTTLCRGLLTSRHCIHLENATKLISGFKKPGDADRDCSFLARANGRTWVTCEFDTLASSPQYHDLMGKIRRIFDGETTATYGNHDEDRIYEALRTPWIRAGTPRMIDHDQSQLGDRFLRFILVDPDDEDRRTIARRALQLERSAILGQANCTAGSITEPETRRAHGLTGGYVDWLRANIEEIIPRVRVSPEAEDHCIDVAELCAELRARPQQNRGKIKDEGVEAHDYKEMPTRLARQYIRLAVHLAATLNREAVDNTILCIVRRVALDTAAGRSLNIVRWACSTNPKDGAGRSYQETDGLAAQNLQSWCDMSADRLARYLAFMRNLGIIEWRHVRPSIGGWFLTDRIYDLYLRVMRK